VKWPSLALLAIFAALAACMREPEEPLAPDVVDETPAPKPWLNVPIPEGEEGCELRQIAHAERKLRRVPFDAQLLSL
jgi:hypothetical protein